MLNATLFSCVLLSCALSVAAQGQDRHDWQSLSRLQTGDRVRVSLKGGPVIGELQNWTPQNLTFGTTTAKRDDVLKIERYRRGRTGAKYAALGAVIGFGVGFAVGAAKHPCYCATAKAGTTGGGLGAVLGAIIGAFVPHSKELIYSSR